MLYQIQKLINVINIPWVLAAQVLYTVHVQWYIVHMLMCTDCAHVKIVYVHVCVPGDVYIALPQFTYIIITSVV